MTDHFDLLRLFTRAASLVSSNLIPILYIIRKFVFNRSSINDSESWPICESLELDLLCLCVYLTHI